MKTKTYISLFILLAFFLNACKEEQNDDELITVDFTASQTSIIPVNPSTSQTNQQEIPHHGNGHFKAEHPHHLHSKIHPE